MIYDYYVYILANKKNGTLYVGVTNDLQRRVGEHKAGCSTFTKKHSIHVLVYYELFSDPENAIKREKQIKGGSRKKKLELIEKKNPNWIDLFPKI